MGLQLWPTLIGIYAAGWMWASFSCGRVMFSRQFQIEEHFLCKLTGAKPFRGFHRVWIIFSTGWKWPYHAWGIYRMSRLHRKREKARK